MWYCVDWWNAQIFMSSFQHSKHDTAAVISCQQQMCAITFLKVLFGRFCLESTSLLLCCCTSGSNMAAILQIFRCNIICDILISWSCSGDWCPRTLYCSAHAERGSEMSNLKPSAHRLQLLHVSEMQAKTDSIKKGAMDWAQVNQCTNHTRKKQKNRQHAHKKTKKNREWIHIERYNKIANAI